MARTPSSVSVDGGWRAMARTPVNHTCASVSVARSVSARACLRERVLGERERVPGLICASSPSCANGCPGCGGYVLVFSNYIPVSTFPGLFPLASAIGLMGEVLSAP